MYVTAAKKIIIVLFYCKATSEAANSPQGETMPQRVENFLCLLGVLFWVGLWGVEAFSTLWKKSGNLLLSGDFQMPFQGPHSGFSGKPQRVRWFLLAATT